MKFKTCFSLIRKRMSGSYDVPQFFREFMTIITDVPEEEWDTEKDPTTHLMNENTIRSYTTRKLPKKFANSIVYHLNRENLLERIDELPDEAKELLASDFSKYDPTIDSDNVAEKITDLVIGSIVEAAQLAPVDDLTKEKQLEASLDLKKKYGDFLLREANDYCAFPGCGRSLIVSNNGRTSESYEITRIKKDGNDSLDNLIAICPSCFALYQVDSDKKIVKKLSEAKKILANHRNNVLVSDDVKLEQGLTGVITQLKKLKQDAEPSDVVLDPKMVKEKIKQNEDPVMYIIVTTYVNTYFGRINQIMKSLDKQGVID